MVYSSDKFDGFDVFLNILGVAGAALEVWCRIFGIFNCDVWEYESWW